MPLSAAIIKTDINLVGNKVCIIRAKCATILKKIAIIKKLYWKVEVGIGDVVINFSIVLQRLYDSKSVLEGALTGKK